jgi:TPR repeat protein
MLKTTKKNECERILQDKVYISDDAGAGKSMTETELAISEDTHKESPNSSEIDWENTRSIRVAAEQGDANMQFIMGGVCFQGKGLEKDHRQAIMWFRKAAGQDQPNAQCLIGLMHATGEYLEKDLMLAYKWMSRAVLGGHWKARSYTSWIESMMAADQVQLAKGWKPASTLEHRSN